MGLSNQIQFKSINGGLKDVDVKGRTVTGYFSAFGNKDSDNDIILPGAFSKTVSECGPTGSNRIQFLWQHDSKMPLGKPHILKEDPYGLYFEAKVANTSYGNDALNLYDAGVINEHSIGFNVIKSTDKGDHTELKELKLWEGSAVTWGANEMTPCTGMKSKFTKDQVIEKFDNLMKGIKAGTFTGENEYLLVLAFNELKAKYADMFSGDSDEEATPAIPSLAEPLDPLKSNRAADALDPQSVINALNDLKSKIS